MARLIIPLIVIAIIIVSVWFVSRRRNRKGVARSLSTASVQSLTGDRLLQHVLYLIETYGDAAKEKFPQEARELFFHVISVSEDIGQRYSSSVIPVNSAANLKALLTEYLVNTNEFYLRTDHSETDEDINRGYRLIAKRLDDINQVLVYSNKHQLGVSNYYLESKNNHQPPVPDDL